MSKLGLVALTEALVRIPSVSRWSNAAVSDFAEEQMALYGFEVERLAYTDPNGEQKVSLVGQIGSGDGGLAFFSHSDTVPGQEDVWHAFDPWIEEGRLYGRGSCDMKGPFAATLIAAASVDPARLKQPVFVVLAADEEIGGYGAIQITAESQSLQRAATRFGVVAEPTKMTPVYAHKGVGEVVVTAHGRAAHSSKDTGISANFLIAPFLAEMAMLNDEVKRDEAYMNHDFVPPTNGFNMTINDFGCRVNVTADKSQCRISFRPMPRDNSAGLIERISDSAKARGFDVESRSIEPFAVDPSSRIVAAACRATGTSEAETVPYGTDAFWLQEKFELVVLGPGDIGLANTVGENLPVADLEGAVEVYKKMIDEICC
jgi:acetylornithine deacetylase